MESSRKAQLLKHFAALYPNPASELNFSNDFQLVVAVMLSAQCTDKKVNEVTPELFRRYPTFKDLREATLSELEAIIRPVNYYRTKARNLLSMANNVAAHFGGKVPTTHEELTSLAGVGNKTANVVLSEQGVVPAFPVDTHVFRVSRRLGLTKGKDVIAVEEDLRKSFPPSAWRSLHHWLILHGRRVCKAQNPQCESCGVAALCPRIGVIKKKKLIRPNASARDKKRTKNS